MSKSLFVKFSLLISAAILTIAILTACKCRACQEQEEGTVPLEVLIKADSFIVASTGKAFFDTYITADFAKSKHTPPYYEMAYKLFIPDKPYVNATIKFTVDSTGNIMKNRDIVGIPRCKDFPYECDFNIDEETARLIATKMGLKEGIREWDAGFIWDFKFKRYVWKILSTLTELGEGDHYKATGQEILIDPNTGEMLALNNWRIN